MRVSVVQRHAVLDAETAGGVEDLFRNTINAQQKTGCSHHLVLSYKPELLEAEYMSGKESELGRYGIEARFREWISYDYGINFYSALEIGGACDVRFIVNVDDFPVDDEGLRRAFEYAKEGLLGGRLVAVGQRRRIRLSADERLNARRQIHEMFMATLFPSSDRYNPFGIDLSETAPAYVKYGDRFPGFYGINHINPLTARLLMKLKEARKVADMDSTVCSEYLLSLLAAEDGQLPIICVPVLQKNQGSKRSEDEVNGMISYSSRQMLKTELGKRLESHVRKPETAETIAGFYPKDEVMLVKQLMLS